MHSSLNIRGIHSSREDLLKLSHCVALLRASQPLNMKLPKKCWGNRMVHSDLIVLPCWE